MAHILVAVEEFDMDCVDKRNSISLGQTPRILYRSFGMSLVKIS